MSEPVARRGFRFSLRTILVAVVFVALVMAQFVAVIEIRRLSETNRRLAQENEELRIEAGYLTVGDPDKVQVLQLRELDVEAAADRRARSRPSRRP